MERGRWWVCQIKLRYISATSDCDCLVWTKLNETHLEYNNTNVTNSKIWRGIFIVGCMQGYLEPNQSTFIVNDLVSDSEAQFSQRTVYQSYTEASLNEYNFTSRGRQLCGLSGYLMYRVACLCILRLKRMIKQLLVALKRVWDINYRSRNKTSRLILICEMEIDVYALIICRPSISIYIYFCDNTVSYVYFSGATWLGETSNMTPLLYLWMNI